MAFIKTIAMMRRKPGTSHEEFRKYYEERHVPLAMNLLGKYLLDYRRNYNSGEYVAEIVADEEMFMDRSSLRIFTVEEAITDMSRWR